MKYLRRFFHFHEGTIGQRAVKIAGSFIAAALLMTGTSVITATDVRDTAASGLRLASNPCRDVVVLHDSVAVTWTTTTNTDDNHVMVGADRTYGRVVAASSGRAHTATLGTFASGATVHFRVQSRSTATGATTQSGDCTIRIPGDDRIPPIGEAASATPSLRDARIDLVVNEPARASLWVLLADGTDAPNVRIAGPVDHATTLHYQISNLTPATAYRVRVDLADPDGNSSTLTPDIEFRTLREE